LISMEVVLTCYELLSLTKILRAGPCVGRTANSSPPGGATRIQIASPARLCQTPAARNNTLMVTKGLPLSGGAHTDPTPHEEGARKGVGNHENCAAGDSLLRSARLLYGLSCRRCSVQRPVTGPSDHVLRPPAAVVSRRIANVWIAPGTNIGAFQLACGGRRRHFAATGNPELRVRAPHADATGAGPAADLGCWTA
jgi:hypothetical protein